MDRRRASMSLLWPQRERAGAEVTCRAEIELRCRDDQRGIWPVLHARCFCFWGESQDSIASGWQLVPSACSVQWWKMASFTPLTNHLSLAVFSGVSLMLSGNAWLNPVLRSWFPCIGPRFCAEVVWSHRCTHLSILHCTGQHKPRCLNTQTQLSTTALSWGPSPEIFTIN